MQQMIERCETQLRIATQNRIAYYAKMERARQDYELYPRIGWLRVIYEQAQRDLMANEEIIIGIGRELNALRAMMGELE